MACYFGFIRMKRTLLLQDRERRRMALCRSTVRGGTTGPNSRRQTHTPFPPLYSGEQISFRRCGAARGNRMNRPETAQFQARETLADRIQFGLDADRWNDFLEALGAAA